MTDPSDSERRRTPESNVMSNTDSLPTVPNGTAEPSNGPSLKFSFSKGPATSIRNTSKTTITLSHDDSGSEDEGTISKVTHFENGTSPQTKERRDTPLIIKPPESQNEHWLQRRLKMFRPDLIDRKPAGVDLSSVPDKIGASTTGGLHIPAPTQRIEHTNEDTEVEHSVDVPKSEDEMARDLLIRQAQDPNAVLSNQAKLVIQQTPLSESDVYAYDMAHLSDAPTLETYERVPVEAFGMGILLGLGWKEGTDLRGGKIEKFQEPKKRADFLGIGAKEEDFMKVDEKGKKVSRKDGLGASWNPLKKIDKVTGEEVKESTPGREGTPREQGSRRGSRHGTPREERSTYSSPRDRDYNRRDYERNDSHDRRYDSDQGSKRKDRSESKYERREYDSDYDRKRRKDERNGDSGRSSHKTSRRQSPRESRRHTPERWR